MEIKPEATQERAKRLMAMGQMAASLAHEIRNPLGSMELYCTILKKDLDQLPNAKTLVEQIHAGIRRLDRIISNCLQFSSNLTPKKKQQTSFRVEADEVLGMAEGRAQNKNVSISFTEKGEHPFDIDPYLVGQALLNVLFNAIDAASDGTCREPQVCIESDCGASEYWMLRVWDSGDGISDEEVEQIFDPFYTTKNDGTGLGLAIVHSIVCGHGGQVRVVSNKEAGTTFEMKFPNQLPLLRQTELCEAANVVS